MLCRLETIAPDYKIDSDVSVKHAPDSDSGRSRAHKLGSYTINVGTNPVLIASF